MANPFEDPDVKAAKNVGGGTTTTTTGGGGGGYGDNVYDNNNNIGIDIDGAAMNVGKTVMNNEMNKMNEEMRIANANTSNHNERPPPPAWIERCFSWLPIRTLALFGGFCFLGLPWIDLLLTSRNNLTFSGFFILFYLFLFGFCIVCIESPSWRCTRSMQLGIYFWARFCSRMWGRATFYLFISILSFALWEDGYFSVTALAGIYMVIIGILMYIVSWTAAKKYVRIFVYIASGSEGDLLKNKFLFKFDDIDIDKDGKISSEAIVKIASEAGRTLTNAERHAIQSFLDESCNGNVTKDDWMRQFMNNNMKIKFL
jgi:hypothetical protein